MLHIILCVVLLLMQPPARAAGIEGEFGLRALFDASRPNEPITLWRDVTAAEKAVDLMSDGVPLSDAVFTNLRACRVPPRSLGLLRQEYMGGAMIFITQPSTASCVGFALRSHIWVPSNLPPDRRPPPAARPAPAAAPVNALPDECIDHTIYELKRTMNEVTPSVDPLKTPECKAALARRARR